jgi:hypothetical protein
MKATALEILAVVLGTFVCSFLCTAVISLAATVWADISPSMTDVLSGGIMAQEPNNVLAFVDDQ